MASFTKTIRRSFNTGEVSPEINVRDDVEKHMSACQKLENFYVSATGSVSRRNGTFLLSKIGLVNEMKKVRLVPFEYNREFSRILVFHPAADSNKKYFYKSSPFNLGSAFSICMKLPVDFSDIGLICKKGNLSVGMEENRVLFFTVGDIVLKTDTLPAAEISIVITISNKWLKVYADTEFIRNSPVEFINNEGAFEFYGARYKGDFWNIKIFSFDINNEYAPYTLLNYQNLVDENSLTPKIPQWGSYSMECGSYLGYNNQTGIIEISINNAQLGKWEYISVPIDIYSGAKVSLLTGEDFLANGIEVYFADSANIQESLFNFGNGEISAGANALECIAPMAANRLVFKTFIEIGKDFIFSGSFSLKSTIQNVLSSIDSTWASDDVVVLDVYDINGKLEHSGINTSIPSAALQEFQYKQVNGYFFIVHSLMPPQKLELTENGKWEFSRAVDFQPSQSDAVKDVILTIDLADMANSIVEAGASGTIKSSIDFFTADMIGSQIKVDYIDEVKKSYKWPYLKTNNGISNGYYKGKKTLFFAPSGTVTVKPEGGIWDGYLALKESTTGVNGPWNEIGRTTSINGSSNTEFKREIFSPNSIVCAELVEQNQVKSTSGSTVESKDEGCFFNIYTDSTCSVWLEITAVADSTSATVKFINPCRGYLKSSAVYLSAWSDKFGYPRTVDIHEERLTFGGNINQPVTVWLSQTNNWNNFRSISNLETDPLAYTLAADEGEPITFIVSKSDMMIGTGVSEWSLGSRDASAALTQSAVRASNQSEDGTEFVMPAKAGSFLMYLRRGGLEMGAIQYDFASDAYSAVSMTTLASHILGDGGTAIFNQVSPQNRIHILRKDGQLAVFTYDKENQITAWSRFTFGDGVVSACALSTGRFKSIFLAVKRGKWLCLERLDCLESGCDNWLDCSPISENVDSDDVDINARYASVMRTTPIFQDGNVRMIQVQFRLINSWGGKFRIVGYSSDGQPVENPEDWRPIKMKRTAIYPNPPPTDARPTMDCGAGFLQEGSVEVYTDDDAPFTLCSIGLNAK